MRLSFAALVLGAAACGETKSRLQAASDEISAEASVALKRLDEGLPRLPAPPHAPAGVDDELWSDLHWLPPRVVSIGGTSGGARPPLVEWLLTQDLADHPSCALVRSGFSRGYQVEWQESPSAVIVIGTVDLEQVTTCASYVAAKLGGTAVLKGDVLEAKVDGQSIQASFARRGSELVAVIDVALPREEDAGRLRENEAIIGLLRRREEGRSLWVVSTKDVTAAPLHVASEGYVCTMDPGGEQWRLRFVFSDASEAGVAKTAADALAHAVEWRLGVELHAVIAVDDVTMVASFDPRELLAADATELATLQGEASRTAELRTPPPVASESQGRHTAP